MCARCPYAAPQRSCVPRIRRGVVAPESTFYFNAPAITKLGYAADEMKADAKACSKLPACCQKENSEGGAHP